MREISDQSCVLVRTDSFRLRPQPLKGLVGALQTPGLLYDISKRPYGCVDQRLVFLVQPPVGVGHALCG